MTEARDYARTVNRRGQPLFFIDGVRVKESVFHGSLRKSEAQKAQPRNRESGRYLAKAPELRKRPRPLVVPARIPRPMERPVARRFIAKVRARPRVGRMGDEYVVVTLEVDALDREDILAAAEAAFPDLVPFLVVSAREA